MYASQRRELSADRGLIRTAIEEVLRFEAPSPVRARYRRTGLDALRADGTPERSVMLPSNSSANREERHHPDPYRFDLQRSPGHLSFGHGLDSALAPVALEEVLNRGPDWEVDYSSSVKAHTARVRGWARLPITTMG